MAEIPHKKELSGKLMTMKFMQRQQERETRAKLEQEKIRVVTEAHWVVDRKGLELPKPKFQVEYEPSYLQMYSSQSSAVGRTSFKKFNKTVERTAKEANKTQLLERELKREREGELSDEEMAKVLGVDSNDLGGGGGSAAPSSKKLKTTGQTNRRQRQRTRPILQGNIGEQSPQASLPKQGSGSNDGQSEGSSSTAEELKFIRPKE